jgi:hypothetical protein
VELTKQEAISIYESDVWKKWSDMEVVQFQLFTPKLCIPFERFHEAVENVLGRPVYTHEFGLNADGLKAEFLGEKKAPTLKEIIELIPKEKRIILREREAEL